MARTFNPSAVLMRVVLDKQRDAHEAIKFMVTSQDNSPKSKQLRENTSKNSIYRQRYMLKDMEDYRDKAIDPFNLG